jgi:glycosyltransferase involved in cell wall biosynthesis
MSSKSAGRPRKLLYLQYTNPTGYPPLEQSSQILAAQGWQVLFLGTTAPGTAGLRFPPHANIRLRQMPFQTAGWRQKLHYLRFCVWVLAWIRHWQPDWLYVSDPAACPPALLAQQLLRRSLIYHEHDSPEYLPSASAYQRLIARARRQVTQRAVRCVLPNQQRLARFVADTGADPARSVCVWNCPRLAEVLPEPRTSPDVPLCLYYHGSIGAHRLPMALLEAMAEFPGQFRLHIVGYETIGTRGYLAAFRQRAQELGLAQVLRIVPPQSRYELWPAMRRAAIGLGLVMGDDINLRMMVGASNKVFDYMAAGLAVLVPHGGDWHTTFVEPGYGLACDPADPASIATALAGWLDAPERVAAMGEAGRRRIHTEWNYERQFAPVLEQLCAA